MFRAQSANDYYVVRANSLDNSVRLYRMEKGKRSQLAMKEAPLGAGQWHSLRVIASNDRFEVALDGKPLFEVTDRSCRRPARWVSGARPTASPTTAPARLAAGALERFPMGWNRARSSHRNARTGDARFTAHAVRLIPAGRHVL